MMTATTKAAVQRLQAVRANLKARFPKRDTAIELMLASLVADEFVILYGTPGTGKSALVEALMKSITAENGGRDSKRFTIGLSRSTPLADIVGDIDIPAWERTGVRSYNTSKHLPSAEVVFLDEIFKGEGAILQGLLRVINERMFEERPVSLRWLAAASNELLPEFRGMMNGEAAELMGEESMRAFADRFFYGYEVAALVKGSPEWASVIRRTLPADNGARIDLEEVRELHEAAVTLPWSPKAWESFAALAVNLAAGYDDGTEHRKVEVSDRRWSKAYKMAAAHAVLRGASQVAPSDLAWLEHGLWTTPDQQALVRKVIRLCAPPAAAEAMEATEAMAAFAEAYLQGRLIAAPSGSGAELQILNERVDPNDTRVTAAWLKLNGRLNKQVNVLAKSLLEQDDEDTKATITAAVDTLRRLSAACADAANAAAKR
jgi:MoxR-like ATPase